MNASIIPVYDPPTSPEFVQPFWDAVARRALALPRCSVCGKWQWYPEVGGTDCAGGTLAWEDVALTGTVYSFTRFTGRSCPSSAVSIRIWSDWSISMASSARGWSYRSTSLRCQIGRRVRARFEQLGDRLHPVFEAAP